MAYEHKQDRASLFGPYLAGFQPRIIIEEILHELQKARCRFPDQNIWVSLAALTEEVGELNQAVLQLNHEQHKFVTPSEVYTEALHVAVMAIRVALDCEYMPTNG